MVLANLSHAERLDHDALLDGLSKVTTQKGLIYHQKRETSEKCPNILLERERERERERKQHEIVLLQCESDSSRNFANEFF